ncbi:MAG: phospholipid carrier-dependent glycosyltransferase, partial [Paenibacillus sp.]|nr:phospholipid carrier-dependent glycosyltransferase [Paenibacillus sp.]
MVTLLRRVPLVVWILLLVALLIRMGLAVSIVGHPTDMNTFKAWAIYAAEHGLGKFYSGEIFADYPPGYIYVLYLIGKIRLWFDLDHSGSGFLLLVKMPAILADLAASLMIYLAAAQKWKMPTAVGIMVLYALNPAIFVNSAMWGQVDSIFTLLVVTFVLLAVRNKLPYAALVFALALLVKPQTLIFTPVLLFALYRNRNWRTLLWSAVTGFATFIVLVLPFGSSKGFFWIVQLYSNTLASYPYASLNAFNLFALTGGNWVSVSSRFLLSYQVWGILFILLTVAYSVYIFYKYKEHSSVLLFISVIIITLVFVCTAKMHERYLFPALLLTLFSYIKLQDRRLLFLYIGLSITHFVNVAYVLSFNVQEMYHLPRYNVVLLITSAANVILTIYMLVTANGLYRGSPNSGTAGAAVVQPFERLLSRLTEPNPVGETKLLREARLSRNDFIIIGVITLIYAVVAFYKLGDYKAPETYWKPVTGDSVIFDLGSTFPIQKINLYGGVGGGKYVIETSTDSKQWTSANVTEPQYTSVFTWNTLTSIPPGRFIRLTADSSNIRLHEIGVFVNGDQSPAHIQGILPGVSGGVLQGNPEKLIDEQDRVPFTPSFMNSMYFDEIYHGRTAYEHIHKIEPYETTHPPLGKDIIALGVLVFGMDPFGWRVVGTIFGILMIPLMYVFAFSLFQRTMYASWATLLLAFDFMHFVQ